MNNWVNKSIFYHIYPLGFCGAPKDNNYQETSHSILKIIEWIPHMKSMYVGAVYLGPIFKSSAHGYDTTDYTVIDNRLGTNEDFKKVCEQLHKNDIKIVLDGVFNHVGRDFFAFKDVQQNGSNSKYVNWFSNLRFGINNPKGDNFTYDAWEGHYNLVKLNLKNEEVCDYLLESVGIWIDEFGVDGIRLDAADCVDIDFFKKLVSYTKSKKDDFWLMAEIIHGDYTRWANPDLLDSVTNYQCYKGIWSSHNDKNYFEIDYSLKDQFQDNGKYSQIYTYNFVDNHDVIRLASVLKDLKHLENCYTLMYTMPGVPSIYYGSEFAIKGIKDNGDDEIRPCLQLSDIPENNSLIEHITKLGKIRSGSNAFGSTSFQSLMVTNEQYIYKRECDGEIAYIAFNIGASDYNFSVNVDNANYKDQLGNTDVSINGNNMTFTLRPYSSAIITNPLFENIKNKQIKTKEENDNLSSDNNQTCKNKEIKIGVYLHKKTNKKYEVISNALHSETLEELIIYRALYDDQKYWVRPKKMFLDPPDRFIFLGEQS